MAGVPLAFLFSKGMTDDASTFRRRLLCVCFHFSMTLMRCSFPAMTGVSYQEQATTDSAHTDYNILYYFLPHLADLQDGITTTATMATGFETKLPCCTQLNTISLAFHSEVNDNVDHIFFTLSEDARPDLDYDISDYQSIITKCSALQNAFALMQDHKDCFYL